MRTLYGLGWAALALLLTLPPAGRSGAATPAEHAAPPSAPIVDLPRLTPAGPASPPLEPGILWEHPPEVAAPLFPVTPPGQAVVSAPPPPPLPSPTPAPVPAAKPQPVRRTMVATAGIFLRATPGADGQVLDTVEKGEQVEAYGAPVDGWQRVGRGGKASGYVAAEYLAGTGPVAAGPYAKAAPEDRGCALPDDLSGRAQRSRLAAGTPARLRAAGNLRVAPVCDAKVLDVLEAGDRVTVLGTAGDWYKVGRDGRTLGYVGGALLAPVRR